MRYSDGRICDRVASSKHVFHCSSAWHVPLSEHKKGAPGRCRLLFGDKHSQLHLFPASTIHLSPPSLTATDSGTRGSLCPPALFTHARTQFPPPPHGRV